MTEPVMQSLIIPADREDVIRLLQEFHYQTVEVPADVLATSGREVNAQYQEKLIQ